MKMYETISMIPKINNLSSFFMIVLYYIGIGLFLIYIFIILLFIPIIKFFAGLKHILSWKTIKRNLRNKYIKITGVMY